MAESGFVFATRQAGLRDGLSEAIEKLPTMAREVITDLFDHLPYLSARVSEYEQRLAAMARESESARRLQTIPGIGSVTALAIVATVGDAMTFVPGGCRGRAAAEQLDRPRRRRASRLAAAKLMR